MIDNLQKVYRTLGLFTFATGAVR